MIAQIFMINRLLVLTCCFVVISSCTDTYTPTKIDTKEKTVSKETEIVAFKEKKTLSKISFNTIISSPKVSANAVGDIVEFDSNKKNNVLKYSKYSHQIKINAEKTFSIPLYRVEKAIIEKTTISKKQSHYSHNPIGSLSLSVLMMGSIEAWCLLEWTAQVIPGEQTNIFMEDCKNFYLGDKKKTTEVIEKKLGAKPTGKSETKTEKLKAGDLSILVNGKQVLKKTNISVWNSISMYEILNKAPSLDMPITITFKLSFRGKTAKQIVNINSDMMAYEINLFKLEDEFNDKKNLFNKLKDKIGGVLKN